MAMLNFRLDFVLSGENEEIPVEDRAISRDRLHAHYGQTKVAKELFCMEFTFKRVEDRCC